MLGDRQGDRETPRAQGQPTAELVEGQAEDGAVRRMEREAHARQCGPLVTPLPSTATSE